MDFNISNLRIQLFKINLHGLPQYWIGSFNNLAECCKFIKDMNIPIVETKVTTNLDLPRFTDAQYQEHLKMIETEIVEARLILKESNVVLAEKIMLKSNVNKLEEKLRQFKLHYFQFVKEAQMIC